MKPNGVCRRLICLGNTKRLNGTIAGICPFFRAEPLLDNYRCKFIVYSGKTRFQDKALTRVDDIFQAVLLQEYLLGDTLQAVLLQSGSVFLFPDIKQRLSDNQLGIITHIISGSKFHNIINSRRKCGNVF